MKPTQRQQKIVELLLQHGQVSVDQLIALLQVSAVTVRNDLRTLQQQEKLIRTRGGAAVGKLRNARAADPAARRGAPEAESFSSAQRIAQRAASFVREGDTILIESSPMGLLVGGPDHLVTLSNSAFERLFQYSPAEAIGRDPDDLIGIPNSPEATDFSRQVMGGQSVHATTIRRRKDGSRIHVEVHATPLFSGGTLIGCVGIYQDITERAQLARELHDGIRQRLALVAVQLAAQTTPGLEASRTLVDDILSDILQLSRRLYPGPPE